LNFFFGTSRYFFLLFFVNDTQKKPVVSLSFSGCPINTFYFYGLNNKTFYPYLVWMPFLGWGSVCDSSCREKNVMFVLYILDIKLWLNLVTFVVGNLLLKINCDIFVNNWLDIEATIPVLSNKWLVCLTK